MTLLTALLTSSRTFSHPALAPPLVQTRLASSRSGSPYGRTHVWKLRPKTLPSPMVPVYPQRLVRVDGSTVVHLTSSPRAAMRLTRDTTNHPVWNATRFVGMEAEEDGLTGRLGRFSRRFAELGMGNGQRQDLSWMEAEAKEGASRST
ncbi:uncharacterized protein BXZ73DRAFT_100130 [Epithele typhae]|uniref:uncharacterized protein n=1 Tax=Epithele typhae TaxID=378194 RepID=UPI002007DD5A|nr:uncharacterized protein BXZ73DRAFT_100130 [Epithele typhae]KAH9937915.1 hypothetical protein BXZ73DRAFT_100130 [Epithele typhae]